MSNTKLGTLNTIAEFRLKFNLNPSINDDRLSRALMAGARTVKEIITGDYDDRYKEAEANLALYSLVVVDDLARLCHRLYFNQRGEYKTAGEAIARSAREMERA